MRKVIVTEFISLDGVIENPMWTFQFGSKEQEQYKHDELFASDALLLGRVTYEGFAQAWPGRTDEAGYADRINSLPKYVVSTTLKNPEWSNSQVIEDDIPGAIAKLKEQPGQDILVFGSGKLTLSLIDHGLIDEYRLMIFPIVLGEGQRLFPEGRGKTTLKHVDTKTFGSGVTVLTYEPDKK